MTARIPVSLAHERWQRECVAREAQRHALMIRVEAIVGEVLAPESVEAVYLVGSLVEPGAYDAASDIDIAVLGPRIGPLSGGIGIAPGADWDGRGRPDRAGKGLFPSGSGGPGAPHIVSERIALLVAYLDADLETADRLASRLAQDRGLSPDVEASWKGCMLHNLYGALEHLFERVARTFENQFEGLSHYHAELLRRMMLEIPAIQRRRRTVPGARYVSLPLELGTLLYCFA